MKIIHSGFDTIVFAIQGALSAQSLEHLAAAKIYTTAKQQEAPIQLGICTVPMNLMHHGQTGGYAYVLNTGSLGALLSFKDNLDRKGWNGFVKIRAQALAVYGWRKCIADALQILQDIGFYTLSVSMNRVDYCMDFLNMGIELNPNHFVAHARVTKQTHYQKPQPLDKQSISRSDRVESITLGKMPGRQVIIYDKRAEAIAKKNPFWFRLWDIDRKDITQTIHRVELRAGKKELDKYRIKARADFETRIGDIMNKTVRAVRYVVPCASDTNVSRYPNHSLWDCVTDHVQTQLLEHTSRIEPDTVLEVIREEKTREFMQQIIGNIPGLCVCLRVDYGDIPIIVPKLIDNALQAALSKNPDKFSKTYIRAKDKYRFINPK